MKTSILMVHNYYQIKGGEDISTDQEIQLLRNHGHIVELYSRNNDEISHYSITEKSKLLMSPIWSSKSYREIETLIRSLNPDIVHIQNFFPLISPSVIYCAKKFQLPVVCTLRNYRHFCPTGTFFREGSICEECVHKSLLHGIYHKCYRNSVLQTAVVASMIKTHRIFHTWQKYVDKYITLTKFSKEKHVSLGFQENDIIVRSNFIESDPGIGSNSRNHIVFVGRLTPEKGLHTLIDAWKNISEPLLIIGNGPMYDEVREKISKFRLNQIQLLGHRSYDETLALLKTAKLLIMPSIWYETFGRTIIEAYATGTPVIVSRMGAMEELVEHGKSGYLFKPGSADDLSEKVNLALSRSAELSAMRQYVREKYLRSFSSEVAYRALMEIYEQLLTRQH